MHILNVMFRCRTLLEIVLHLSRNVCNTLILATRKDNINHNVNTQQVTSAAYYVKLALFFVVVYTVFCTTHTSGKVSELFIDIQALQDYHDICSSLHTFPNP